jgi:hypothetical protein
MKKLSCVFATVGIVLMICSFFGRFIDSPAVFGRFVHGGIAASHVMIGADTFLLLAILAYLYKKD